MTALRSYRPIRTQIQAKMPGEHPSEYGALLTLFLVTLAARGDVSPLVAQFSYEDERRTLHAFGVLRKHFAGEIHAIETVTETLRAWGLAQGWDPVLVERGIEAQLSLELLGDADLRQVLRKLEAWFRARPTAGPGGT